MKQIKCNVCEKRWYVDDEELEFILFCSFCGAPTRKKAVITDVDTLGKAIYEAIINNGLDILVNTGRISGYLLDVAPNLKKETRIFCKTFDDNYLLLYKDAFNSDLKTAEVILNKLKSMFIEEEGLSETWAEMLYENCLTSIMYYKGEGIPDIVNVEVTDINLNMNQENKLQYGAKTNYESEENLTENNLGGRDLLWYEVPTNVSNYTKWLLKKR